MFTAKPLVKSVGVLTATRSTPACAGCEVFDVESAACVVGARVKRLLHDTKTEADEMVEREKQVRRQW